MIMKQPALGLKISELRQSKGLTQEELVKRCNLSVRTLQRIEAGEVEPRGYTLKLISEALGYNFFKTEQQATSGLKSKWKTLPGKLFPQKAKELFNLKTNTMKKLTILSLPLILLSVLLIMSNLDANARSKRVRQKDLLGTWQLCSNEDSLPDTNYNGREGQVRYKLITPESFMVVDVVVNSKEMYAAFMGDYTIEKSIYTEYLKLSGRNYKQYLGEKNILDVYFKDGLLFVRGANNHYNEIWMKLED